MKSDATVAAEIFRKVQATARVESGQEVHVRLHPDTAHYLETERGDALERLQTLIGRKVVMQAVASYHREQYDVAVK